MLRFEFNNIPLCHVLRTLFSWRSAVRSSGMLLAALLFLLAGIESSSSGEIAIPQEYQIKAAFLYTITKFVDWPAGGSAAQSQSLNIAVLGQDPFGAYLEPIRGKSAKGRTIMIRHFRRVEDVKDADVVFISTSEKGRLARILRHLKNSHMLTVADQGGFCEAGGMINLVTVQNKVVFEINVAAARHAQLTISSHLLKLARIVTE